MSCFYRFVNKDIIRIVSSGASSVLNLFFSNIDVGFFYQVHSYFFGFGELIILVISISLGIRNIV